jgi:CHAT domain-containing protein
MNRVVGVPFPADTETVNLRYSGSDQAAANHVLLVGARQLTDQQLILDLVSHNPQLLNGYVLVEELAAIPEGNRTHENRNWYVLAMLEVANRRLESSPERFPVGNGPLEQVRTDLVRGYISLAAALDTVRDPEFVWCLSGAYLRAVSRQCVVDMQDPSKVQAAWWMQELVLEAVADVPGLVVDDVGEVAAKLRTNLDFMYDEAVSDWLLAANNYLQRVPDARVYWRAQELGLGQVERLRARGRPELAGRVAFRLGALGLDPYAQLPTAREPARALLRSKLLHALGDPLPLDVDMPSLDEALSRSEEQLRTAVDLATGELRARSLKALFDCRVNQRLLGVVVGDEELVSVGWEAIAGMDAERDRHHIASVRAVAQRIGLPLDQTHGGPPASTAGGEGTSSYAASQRVAFETRLLEAASYAGDDPEGALQAMIGLQAEARSLGTTAREQLWEHQARLLRDQADSPFVALADLGRRFLISDQLITENREQESPELFRGWEQAWAGAPCEPPAELVQRHLMRLAVNAAVNFVVSAPVVSVRWYGEALGNALELDAIRTTDLVVRLGLLARDHRDPEVSAEISDVLCRHARALYAAGGTVHIALHRTVQHALAAVLQASGPVEGVADRLRQLLKGLGFAFALAGGTSFTPDDEDRVTLAEMATLTPGPAVVEESGSTLFAEDLLLATYTSDNEIRPGATDAERLANMQRAFDEYVFHVLTDGAGEADHEWQDPEQVRSRLDDRTVLFDIIAGIDFDERLVIYVLLSTRSGTRVSRHANPDLPGFPTRAGDGEVLMHPLADNVRRLREALVAHPGLGRDVGREAQAQLAALAARLFDQKRMDAALRRLLAEGRDHLLIVPHGPLHYVPFHLLPFGSGILADEFVVTVLPNRQLLSRPHVDHPPRARSVTAVGMTFADGQPFGLPPLPDSAAEVADVARVFGSEPSVDEGATEHEVLRGLGDSRFVHVSTHGRNTSAGAAFQLLYLWPDADSDGRLHAFELLDQDLSGLRVLTLSACESALGRFDLMDDLRGLPASVLLRGASVMVGTLWEAGSEAAHTFFRTFYESLDTAPNNVREAFRAAQAKTRATSPQFRDWGAFYLLGVT